MIARTAFVALLLAAAIVSLAARAEAAPGTDDRRTQTASASEDAPAERSACRAVKVVYAGHGEAERAPCRPLR